MMFLEGGRKDGDVLGGDRYAVLSSGLSLPVVISEDFTFNLRGKLFYDFGCVWNKNQSKLND